MAAKRFFVAGIGGSAGGIEALLDMLPTLPIGNVAYVVAQHRPASAVPELLARLLRRGTPMPVEDVEEGMLVRPGVMHVVPPSLDVEVVDDRFVTREVDPTQTLQPSIDSLFESIALAYGNNAIGIVLSGTGSDGIQGMLAVKAVRGHTIVQDPANAQFPAMPAAAIDTGAADYIADAAGIGALLEAIAGAGTNLQARKSELSDSEPVDVPTEPTTDSAFLNDRRSFERLRDCLAPIVAMKAPGETIRAWVSDCGNGEDAYSVAMALTEAVLARGSNVRIKIFATDRNHQSLETVRRGVYPVSAIRYVPPDLRGRYLAIKGDRVTVHKHLRDLLIIARHSVTIDPPLVRMDLVFSRDALAHRDRTGQKRVLGDFHFALEPHGLLMLGPSATVPTVPNLFTILNVASNIFRRIGPSKATEARRVLNSPWTRLAADREFLANAVRNHLMARYAPPAVIVDANLGIVDRIGDPSRYLNTASPDYGQLDAMVVPSARAEVSAMLAKAMRDDLNEVSGTVAFEFPDDSVENVDVKVVRFAAKFGDLSDEGSNAPFAVVSFTDHPTQARLSPATRPRRQVLRPPAADPSDPEDLLDRIADLEVELSQTRRNLERLVEELESSNAELRSLNEELAASSEELQATNEELATSMEERQAMNEELVTVNETLQIRTSSLAAYEVVLQNIQAAVNSAVLFVDNEQRVRRFSPMAVKFFGLTSRDLGARLATLPATIDITDRVQTVLDTGLRFMTEVSLREATHLMQIVAYRSHDKIEGAVIALSDITELVRARTALLNISQDIGALTDSDSVAFYRTGRDLFTLMEVSPSLAAILGVEQDDLKAPARLVNDSIHPDDRAGVIDLRVRNRFDNYQADYRMIASGGAQRTLRDISRVVVDEQGRATRRVGLLVDITDAVDHTVGV